MHKDQAPALLLPPRLLRRRPVPKSPPHNSSSIAPVASVFNAQVVLSSHDPEPALQTLSLLLPPPSAFLTSSPQYVPQLFLPIQYLTPSWVSPYLTAVRQLDPNWAPHPAIEISWSWSTQPEESRRTPPAYFSTSSVTHIPHAMGPRAAISAIIAASPRSCP
eukprot:754931-Hanusia_phi.AAC.2